MKNLHVNGAEIQNRAIKLFGRFFGKQLLSKEVLNYKEADDDSVSNFVALLEAEFSNTFPSVAATQFVIEAISNLVDPVRNASGEEQRHSPPTFLLAVIAKLVEKGNLCSSDIQESLNNFPGLLPPLVLVELDKCGIISFTRYFQSNTVTSQKCSNWIRCLIKLACEEANSEEDHAVLHYMLCCIIEIGYGTLPEIIQSTIEGHTQKNACLIVTTMTIKLWEMLWDSPEKKFNIFEIPIDNSKHSGHFQLASFQKCYLDLLTSLISHKPEIKATVAINCQHEWSFFKSPNNVTHFITQLLIPLEAKQVLDKIDDILNRFDVNWKTLLLVISAVQVCYPAGTRLLKALIANFLHRAMEKLDKEQLILSFLLSRQINAENISSTHYGVWFSSITTSTTTSKQFSFLIKFLTSCVRFEPAWVLTAHKSNPPHIPAVDNCRTLWTDYAALVRTRIEDLKVKPTSDEVSEEDISLAKDVNTAIASFEKTSKIPSSVVEAAIFRKPYFVNKFLPILLKPRSTPVPADVRENFIDELRRAGKLPLAQYEAYVTACRKLGQRRCSDEDVMEWEDQPVSDYQTIMGQIGRCRESQQRSFFIERLANLLDHLFPATDGDTRIIFNLEEPENMEPNSIKLVECWIDSLRQSLSFDGDKDWMNRYLLILNKHPVVMRCLYYSVVQYLRDGTLGTENQIRCYGIIIYLLARNSLTLMPVNHQKLTCSYMDFLVKCHLDSIDRSETMLFLLECLYHTVIAAEQDNNVDFIQKLALYYHWLSRRVSDSRKADQYRKYLSAKLPSIKKMNVRDWLRLEINVNPTKDVLQWAERSSYLHSVVEMDYNDLIDFPCIVLDAIVQRTESDKSSPDCSQDLLLLLQSRLQSTPPLSTNDNIPWLTKWWVDMRRNRGNNIDSILWGLICSLPAYLLSRNSFQEPIREHSLTLLSELIQAGWRDSISEGVSLPKYVTVHIIRAVECASHWQLPPCLQFSSQIHNIQIPIPLSGPWQVLEKSLQVFHPLRPLEEQMINPSGSTEIDVLVAQLVALAALLWFPQSFNQEWTGFVDKLSSVIDRNPLVLKGLRVSHWTDKDCPLPWKKILPTFSLHLLPFVLLHLLLPLSGPLLLRDLSTATDYLATLIEAHSQWIETTYSFVESLSSSASKSDYPAGQLLDLTTTARITSAIQKILQDAPLRALRKLQQSSALNQMDADFQTTIRQRIN